MMLTVTGSRSIRFRTGSLDAELLPDFAGLVQVVAFLAITRHRSCHEDSVDDIRTHGEAARDRSCPMGTAHRSRHVLVVRSLTPATSPSVLARRITRSSTNAARKVPTPATLLVPAVIA
jgi:hypothetical protein